jgi:hypothetical protein
MMVDFEHLVAILGSLETMIIAAQEEKKAC